MDWLNKVLLFLFSFYFTYSQSDLESLLGPVENNYYTTSTFMSTRVINGHSIEIFAPGALDVRISHRFGALNTGFYELFGLDQATIRMGLEYGLSNSIMLGVGRSSYKKNYDGFLKYSIFKQSKKNNIPMSLVFFSSFSVESLRKNQENYPFWGRVSYCNQLLIASKINEKLSIQLMPTFVHRNMVQSPFFFNDVYLIGSALKYNITKSTSLNLEYFYRITEKDGVTINQDQFFNSFSIGFDIETGGHVFQLHLTNSLPMYEVGFLTETNENWGDGGLHFGFNISREFTLK